MTLSPAGLIIAKSIGWLILVDWKAREKSLCATRVCFPTRGAARPSSAGNLNFKAGDFQFQSRREKR